MFLDETDRDGTIAHEGEGISSDGERTSEPSVNSGSAQGGTLYGS